MVLSDPYSGEKMKIKQVTAALFAFGLVVAACGGDDGGSTESEPTTSVEETTSPETTIPAGAEVGDPEIDSIRICSAPAFTGLPYAVAVNQGLLGARGIQGEFIQCPSGPANAAALVSNQVDVVANTPDNMLGLRASDFDVVMFGQMYDTQFFDIVVGNGTDIGSCADGDWECVMTALDGKNVGVVARGAAAELIAKTLLSSAGLDPENTTYIATGLAGTTLAALSSQEIDWAITFEPGLSQAVLDGIGTRPFSLINGEGPAALDFPSLVLTTSRSKFDSAPNAFEHFRLAIVEAIEWIRDPANRDAVLAEMQALTGAEGELAEAILDNNVGGFSTTGELDPARLQTAAQFVFDFGRSASLLEFATYAVGPGIQPALPAVLTPETDSVRICQAAAFSGLPAAVAVNQGLLEAKGISGEFIACESGPANAAALVAGEVEFVANTPDNMLGLRNADFDVVMFGQVLDKHFFDIIVSNTFGPIDCEAKDWKCVMTALDGANVGVVARGAAAEQIARQLYESAGLDPDNATYIATGLAGTTLAALSSGEVDYAITFEPGLSQGEQDGIGYLPFKLRDGDGPAELNWPSLVLTTSRTFAEANPNTTTLYRQAIREAMDWIRDPANRAEVLAEMKTLIGVEGPLAEAILDNNVGSFSLNGALQKARIEANVAFAVGRGILTESQDFADFAVIG
jgi:NitT/TauT family transport system substrate-binding protein